jgi:chemotaxis protein MotB
MITFTDLVALLLAFFVMLFAMSKVDFRKWQNLTDSLARGLNAVREVEQAAPSHMLDAERLQLTPGQDLDYLGSVLNQRLAGKPAFAGGEVRQYGDRLVVSLPPRDRLSATAGASEDDALFHVAGLLRQLRNQVEVVGYADAAEQVEDGPSAWRLALTRALWTAQALRAAGYPGDVTARAYVLAGEGGGSAPAQGVAAGRVDLIVRPDAAEDR